MSLRGIVLVIAAVILTPVAPAAHAQNDHLACFKIKDSHAFDATIDIAAQGIGDIEGCAVDVRSKRYCVPAVKQVLSTNAPTLPVGGAIQTDARLCYRVRCPKQPREAVELADQFGARAVLRRNVRTICTPARLAAPTTTVTSTTSTTNTTTSDGLENCSAVGTIDPENMVGALVEGQRTEVVVDTVGQGLFDLFLDDLGAGGTFECPPGGCFMGVSAPGSFTFAYTPPSPAPATIQLRVSLDPHSPGFTCSDDSDGGGATRTFPTAPSS